MKPRSKTTNREGREPSQRQLKMGEQIRHVLSEAGLREDLRDTLGQPVTVTFTEVRCSADLRLAKAYYVPLGDVSEADCDFALTRALPQLQAAVAKKSTSKYTPKLTFVYDRSFDQADHLRTVLADIYPNIDTHQ